MLKVTSVEPQKSSKGRSASGRNPKRFNIFLDGQFAFGADEDLVVEKRLVVGKELTTSDVEQLIKEIEVGKLMERMYRLFSIRQRTEKEVRDYLKNLSFKRKLKGQEEISAFIIDTAVQLMKRKGMINDEDFARAWVEARSKKKGKIAIKAELYQKGIDREIIENVMGDGLIIHDEQETAGRLLEKKIKAWRKLPEIELRKKSYEFLLRRGFEYDIVKDVIENLIKKM